MSAIRNRIAAIQARVDGLLDGMSARDRKLAVGMVLFLSVALVAGGAWWMSGRLDAKAKELGEVQDQLASVKLKAAEYEAAQAELTEVEAELRKNQGQDLSTFMEKAAQTAEIAENLESVREVSVSEQGSLEERKFTVKLNKITQEQAAKFLYQVEATGFPLRVTNAKFKRVKVSGEWVLNLTLEVAAYKLLEEE